MRDRTEWLREKRVRCEERMDTLFAPQYDAHWGHINATHRRVLGQFLDLCPPGGLLLDAACGTGKYWPLIVEAGFAVQGMDQSAGMLAAARAKFPDVPSEKRGLQDLSAEEAFDGICCVDAMENICPEDWPSVLRNFARALKPGAPLYLTVELADVSEIEAAYATGLRLGLPLVRGEWAHEGGYHYYPELGQVRAWLADAGFTRRAEETGDGYFHMLAARAG